MIYFLLVDRFYNGDPSNDGQINLADPQAFHGGDLRGVSEKLEYLDELGVETLWLGPITQMRTEKFYEWGAYHGYWLENPLEVEPRFGTWNDIDALQRGLHKRNIGLALDIVYNHVAPESPRVKTHPAWFHHAGPIVDWHNSAEVMDHDVHGLPDLDQSNPEVYGWLRDASMYWLERLRPAAFRLDAVRHMQPEFVAQIGDEIRAKAGRGFQLWGEVFDGNVAQVQATQAAAKLDVVFDYPLHYALIDVVCKGQPAAAIAAALDRTRGSDPESWITFADNHDTARVTGQCGGSSQRVDLILELLFTLRGRPMITWGTEWGFDGLNEPENRADMRWDSAWPMDRMAGMRLWNTRRKEDEVLRRGEWRTVGLGADWFVVERTLANDLRWVVYNGGEQREIAGITFDKASVSVLTPPREAVSALRVKSGRIVIAADTSVLKSGEQMLIVGDAPEFGGWNADRALVLPATTKLDDAAYVYKLAIRHANGTVTWETGENRWLLGAQPRLQVAWRN